jgi:hypothetical protein
VPTGNEKDDQQSHYGVKEMDKKHGKVILRAVCDSTILLQIIFHESKVRKK